MPEEVNQNKEEQIIAPNNDTLSEAVPTFTDEFGKPLKAKLTEEGQKKIDELNQLSKELEQLNGQENSEKQINEIQEKINAIKAELSNNAEEIYASVDEDERKQENINAQKIQSAWDPRLQRIDAFFMKSGSDGQANVTPAIIPFSSLTAASSFQDMVFTERKGIIDMMKKKHGITTTNDLTPDYTSETSNKNDSTQKEGNNSDKPIKDPNAIYVPVGEANYENDPQFYGTASLMNPYSITKLTGGLGGITLNGRYINVDNNYLYDIRDQRRFYSVNTTDITNPTNILTDSCPTLRNIIAYANSDKWGRTPYQYQDFVYCKYYGIIPNNRMITLRRYHAPTYDNLQFEGMWEDDDVNVKNFAEGAQNVTAEPRTRTKAFSPRCTLVTFCGEDTGNTFSSLLKFTTGIPWDDAEAKIWDVQGEQGEDGAATIDRMFDSGGFTGSEQPMVGKIISGLNTVTGKILSFGKMAAAFKTNFGMDQPAFDNMTKMNQDPYSDGIYTNRIQGPINRVDKVKKRKEGITFEQSFQIKFSYKAKSIGGINPKAAMLDILGNCLEMVSPDALFWGGGHKFMITPKLYPYHDGGWRDSFMKKLYDGKIFGEGGAMDYVLRGVKNFASKGADGKDDGIWSNLQSHFGKFLGDSLAGIGKLISSAASALFGEGSGNFLDRLKNAGKAIAETSDNGGVVDKTKAGVKQLFGNLNNMWHNKVMAQTMVPNIKGMNSLLIGEPVGEWHLTVGNPLNPIMVVGNLICDKMDVEFSDELGPDDFPEEIHVTYSLMHGMARDKAAIQSMFNRGMGKFYDLPDYIKSSADSETQVDHYTGGSAFREPAFEDGSSMLNRQMKQNGYSSGTSTYKNYKVDPGKQMSNDGSNSKTQLITKFTPPDAGAAYDIVGNGFATPSTANLIPVIRSIGINRKYN